MIRVEREPDGGFRQTNNTKKVIRISTDGKRVMQYVSIAHAAHCNNLTHHHIKRSINEGVPFKGFFYDEMI